MKKSNKTISIIAFALFGVVILALVFKKKLVEYITKTSPQKTISELTTSLSQGNQDLKKELLELVQQKIETSTKQIVNQNGNNIILKGIGWKRTIAMQNIARGHVVRITENAGIDQCYTYDPLDIENYGLATGISLHSATAGQECFVQVEGTAEIPDWGLTPNQLMFIGSNGQLTATAPTQGLSQSAGNSISTDELNINFSNPIILNDEDNA